MLVLHDNSASSVSFGARTTPRLPHTSAAPLAPLLVDGLRRVILSAMRAAPRTARLVLAVS